MNKDAGKIPVNAKRYPTPWISIGLGFGRPRLENATFVVCRRRLPPSVETTRRVIFGLQAAW
jgi:hypothetical protein